MSAAESFPVVTRITGRKTKPLRPSKGNPLSFKCTTTYVRQEPLACTVTQGLRDRDWVTFGLALLGRDFFGATP